MDDSRSSTGVAAGAAPRRAGGARRRVTMTDVAREAHCSQTTVSFVLNDNDTVRISRQTRDRVRAAASMLGYALPDASPGAEPARGPDRMIGFAVDHLATSPEAVVAIEGARQAAWEAGSNLLVAQTMSDPEMELRTLRAITAHGISGLIYMTIFTRRITAPAYLYGLGIPIVLLNCYTTDRAFPTVVPDERSGGETSAQHLIGLGHRRIATITGEPWMLATQDRLNGYRRALKAAGIAFDPALVVEGDWSASAGYDATVQLLGLDDPPTAIFCQNDRMAIGCYEALKEAGRRIPEDISVVGYDDEEISRHLHPRLTTSILPHRAMGQWALTELGKGPRRKDHRYRITRFECPLVERDSASAPFSVPPRRARGRP